MSLKFFVLCATLAIARAGYLQPALRYAHAAPIAIPAPQPAALTYTIPPTVKAVPLPPVVTSSYGYSTAHTPVPAPIIRAEPIHHAPVAFAAPAIHAVPAPIALAAPAVHAAPLSFGLGSHFGGHNYAAGFGFGAPAIHSAPAPLAFAAPAIHPVPAPIAFAAPAIHSAPLPAPGFGFAGNFGGSHLGFGHGYAAGFGFGAAPAPFGFGAHVAPAPLAFGHSFAAPGPIGFAGHLGGASFAHSKYGAQF